jgi:hypothetical protein
MTRARDVSSRGGLTKITPSSVTIGSGSSTTTANGNTVFTGVSSIALDGLFSTTFSHYKIIMQHSLASGAPTRLYMRGVNTSGAVVTSSNYYWGFHYWTYANGHGVEGNNGAPFTYGSLGVYDNYAGRLTLEVAYQGDTTINSTMQSFGSGSTGINYISGASLRGLQIYPSAGTISGDIVIYGYNKS